MTHQNFLSMIKKRANIRLCKVSSYTTELLEIEADDPKLHVLFVPGNPGVIVFYKGFLEALYELLGGIASITAIAHLSHTKRNWENGRLFSLQEQIDHKVEFIRQELQNVEVPIILVGHSIGGYIAIETLKRLQEKVMYCVALYPFLMLNNPQTTFQIILGKISGQCSSPFILSNLFPFLRIVHLVSSEYQSRVLSASISFVLASLGLLPRWALRLIVLKIIGRSCSATAVEAACSHLPQYHILRNILFMTKTEFKELLVAPDWKFMRESKDKIAFLYGVDDQWAPLQMYEEISKQVPGIILSIERESLTHNFSCTEAGSVWVARHVASLIKSYISSQGK